MTERFADEEGCRLLWRPDGGFDEAALSEVLALPNLAGVIVAAKGLEPSRLRSLGRTCHDAGKALFVAGDATAAKQAGADGTVVEGAAEAAAARSALGEGSLIGVGCGLSRHEAMTAGEEGADFVLFDAAAPPPEADGLAPDDEDGSGDAPDPLVELVAWWSELFVLPCCAVGFADGQEEALVDAGAAFLLVAGTCEAALRTLRRLDGLLNGGG